MKEPAEPAKVVTTERVEVIAGLNELFEDERAGVASLARLRTEAPPGMVDHLKRIGQAETWYCGCRLPSL